MLQLFYYNEMTEKPQVSPIPECWHNHGKLMGKTQSESIKVCFLVHQGVIGEVF